MRHQFHEEMNNLDAKLLQMGVLVQEALGKSLQCVVKKNLDQAMNVIDEDRLLNNLELGVEADSTKLLALQQPMAVDLRMIIAAIRISGDMERMGDLIKKICQKVTKLKDYDYSAVMPDIEKMYQHVNEMLSDMLKALKDRDVDLAIALSQKDRAVDEHQQIIYRKLLKTLHANEKHADEIMYVMSIIRALERIGDHIENVAEKIIFIKEGSLVHLN